MGEVLRINSVWLQVQDLQAAAKFYRDLFSLSGSVSNSSTTAVLTGRAEEDREFQVVLLQTVPEAPAAIALQHLSFEVASLEDAKELQARAVDMSASVIPPRLQHGCWRGVIFDPAGNRLEIAVSRRKEFPACLASQPA